MRRDRCSTRTRRLFRDALARAARRLVLGQIDLELKINSFNFYNFFFNFRGGGWRRNFQDLNRDQNCSNLTGNCGKSNWIIICEVVAQNLSFSPKKKKKKKLHLRMYLRWFKQSLEN